jgi:serine/threonine protein kinase
MRNHDSDRARFEREIQILGQLSHPNIVGILDSRTASGHFYFIMDYILGVPLDRYVQDGQLPIASGESANSVILSAGRDSKSFLDQTLRLFVKVCDALHAAHLTLQLWDLRRVGIAFRFPAHPIVNYCLPMTYDTKDLSTRLVQISVAIDVRFLC